MKEARTKALSSNYRFSLSGSSVVVLASNIPLNEAIEVILENDVIMTIEMLRQFKRMNRTKITDVNNNRIIGQ